MSPTRLPQEAVSRASLETHLQASNAPELVEPAQPKVGDKFDKYRLLARLATGGMAELFVARLVGASGFQKNVVIKRILPHVAHDANFNRMFLDEAITCAQLSHPNICQVFELCQSQDSHYLVLEHLEGATVGDLIRRCLAANQQVQMNLAAGIIAQACDGLHAAHEQVDAEDNNVGLVHRDVSPGNIFVTVDGIVKLLDFGIAKAAWMSRKTRTGTLLGKCEYMSPEQARGEAPIDRRSDVFSLGVIAWEMLCGRRLFRRESEYETLRAVLRAPIERPRSLRPSIPLAFDNAIMRALERDPDDRFKNAHEFRQAISQALRSSGGPTPMCDIAPIIRRSFADQLRMQRALIKEASKLTSKQEIPGLRKVPRGTLPGSVHAGHGEEAPTLQPVAKVTLPSLAPSPSEDTASMELTFRATPKSTPRGMRLVPAASAEVDKASKPDSIAGAIASEATLQRVANSQRATKPERIANPPIPLPSAPPKVSISAVSATQPQAQLAAQKRLSTRRVFGRGQRRSAALQVFLLLVVGLLGAGLAAALATLYYSQNPSATSAIPSQEPPAAQSESLAIGAQPPDGTSPQALSEPSEANADKSAEAKPEEPSRQAVVTSLAPKGSVTIRSSQPATIYLYPTKEIIGITPLVDFELPPGSHKLKAQLIGGKGRRKYFVVKVEAGHEASRTLNHW